MAQRDMYAFAGDKDELDLEDFPEDFIDEDEDEDEDEDLEDHDEDDEDETID